MSDRLAAVLAPGLAAGPAAADRPAVTRPAEVCPAAPPREAAGTGQHGDGAAVPAGGCSFDSVEDRAGRADAAHAGPGAAPAAVAARMPQEARVADRPAGPTGPAPVAALRAVQGVAFAERDRMRASALAAGGGHRVLPMPNGRAAPVPAQVAADGAGVVRSLRPRGGEG
jgi:hypothetical protein